MDAISNAAFYISLGIMIAIPIWAYWSQHTKVRIEEEKTKQLELKLKLQEDKSNSKHNDISQSSHANTD